MTDARYDGHADWYDTHFRHLRDDTHSAGRLADLLGEPPPDDRRCLDIGCGTGLHHAAVEARGWTVIGADLSADQLRVAATRNHRLLRADAANLPLADASVPAVSMTFIHTDVDDFPAVVAEAARVLRPGGRLVYLGPHPAFVGAFADRRTETAGGALRIGPGYGNERRHGDPTGRFPIRSRVGSRNLTLQTLLGAFLAPGALRLSSFTELDTTMRPWPAGATDGRVVPWNLAIAATRT